MESSFSFLDFWLPWTATISTILVFLGPFPSVNQIWTSRNVGDAAWLPPITMFMNCFLWTSYGLLIGNSTVILVNCVGLACSVYFIFTFYYFSTGKLSETLHQALAACSVVLLAVLLYLYFSSSPNVASHLGLISSLFSVALFGSPLVKLSHVVRVTKSAAGMPMYISAIGAVCSGSWALYGYLLRDWYMFTPNALGFLLSLVQIAIIYLYQGPPELTYESKKESAKTMSDV